MRVRPDEIAAALQRARAAERPTLEVLTRKPGHASRVGLVPGSFDPMTIAHAAIAGALREAGCDHVVLVISARTLPKEEHGGRPPGAPLMDEAARIASLLAYSHRRRWVGVAVASHGLLVDQAEAASRALPGAEVVLGIGSDKLLQLLDERWYEDRDAALRRFFAVAEVAYALRGDDVEPVERSLPDDPSIRDKVRLLEIPRVLEDVSSRLIRAGSEGSIDRWIPSEIRPFTRRSGPEAT